MIIIIAYILKWLISREVRISKLHLRAMALRMILLICLLVQAPTKYNSLPRETLLLITKKYWKKTQISLVVSA